MKKFLAALAVFLLMTGHAFAQDDGGFFDVDLDLAAGWGSTYGEEEDTLSQDAQYGAVHADILGLDLFDASSGVAIEVSFGGALEYTVWSLNRATVPGTNGRIYGGTDFKLIESNEDGGAAGDFDMRVVAGVNLASVPGGALKQETYLTEENREIGFLIVYDFDWP